MECKEWRRREKKQWRCYLTNSVVDLLTVCAPISSLCGYLNDRREASWTAERKKKVFNQNEEQIEKYLEESGGDFIVKATGVY